MTPITMKDLHAAVSRLNTLVGQPTKPAYNQVGQYQLSGAYGGHKLIQIVSTSGGTRDITSGFISKRELYYQINAYTAGLEAGKGQPPTR